MLFCAFTGTVADTVSTVAAFALAAFIAAAASAVTFLFNNKILHGYLLLLACFNQLMYFTYKDGRVHEKMQKDDNNICSPHPNFPRGNAEEGITLSQIHYFPPP